MSRLSWNEYFIEIARAVSLRATCKRRKVGAVLVSSDNRILSAGYNGSLSGKDHCVDGACPRGQKSYDEVPPYSDYSDCIAVHAEVNCLMNYYLSIFAAGIQGVTVGKELTEILSSCILYISEAPCKGCKEYLRVMGIRVIHYPGGVELLG